MFIYAGNASFAPKMHWVAATQAFLNNRPCTSSRESLLDAGLGGYTSHAATDWRVYLSLQSKAPKTLLGSLDDQGPDFTDSSVLSCWHP